MAEKKTVQEAADSDDRQLTWREEKFVELYIKYNNQQLAYLEAGYKKSKWVAQYAHNLVSKQYIYDAIQREREAIRERLKFTRDDALAILIAQATATADEFTEVLKDPRSKKNYKGLGRKKVVIESTEYNSKTGNKVKLISNADRRAAANELWEKLGLGQESRADSWTDGLEELLDEVAETKGRREA